MSRMQFILPWPPTNNHYYTIARGRKVLSSKGRAYKRDVNSCLIMQGVKRQQISGRIDLYIRIEPATNHKRDLDNFLKAPLDALTSANIWLDDSQIDRLCICRGDKSKDGRLVVTVKEIERTN